MPRRPRIAVPGVPLHLIQRGNNRQVCFSTTDDHRCYLDWLAEFAPRCGCQLHAYVLMTNHVHLLLTPAATESASDLMKALGQRYTQYVNRTYQRSGSLWEGRFRSSIVHEESYLLACYRYIELNPVRAGMVAQAVEYPWSSHRANAGMEAGPMPVTRHPLYQALGLDAAEREANYRALCGVELPSTQVEAIRRATNGNFVLGEPGFQRQIGDLLGRRVAPGQAGRPRRMVQPESADLF